MRSISRIRVVIWILPLLLCFSLLVLLACPAHAGGTWPPVGQCAGGYPYDVAVQGNYAYVAAGTAMTVVDISTPSEPHQVAEVPMPGVVTRVAVAGAYAYAAAGEAGLWIVNVSDPANPVVAGTWLWAPPVVSDPIAMDVAVGGGYAYVAHRAMSWSGVVVVDVSDATNPQEAAVWDAPGDIWGVTVAGTYAYVSAGGMRILDISDPVNAHEVGSIAMSSYQVAVAGTYAYVAGGNTGLRVVDVSNPVTPTEVGFWDTAGWAGDVAIAGLYAYVADSNDGLRVIYVSDPAHPVEVGYWDTPGSCSGVALAGGYACVADGFYGVRMIDVSDPTQPASVGSWNPPGYAWGVAAAGGYAYVADADAGLRIVDVTDPTQPIALGLWDTPGWAGNVTVAGAYAYVADGSAGLRVIYVADPAHPVEVGYLDTDGSSMEVVLSGGRAYLADDYGGLAVIDVSTPASPTMLGHTHAAGNTVGVAVVGSYAYVAGASTGLHVIDVSDPASPQQIGSWSTSRLFTDVAAAGHYAYLADDYGVRVIDVADPTDPVQLGYWDQGFLPSAVAVADGRVYVADQRAGLRVLDVSDPAKPVEIGYWDTPGEARGVAVSGDHVYLADYGWGLVIFPSTVPGTLTGQVRASGTGAVIAGATVEAYRGGVLRQSAVANATGIYAMSLPAGRYTMVARKQGYVAQGKAGIVVTAGGKAYANFNLGVSGSVTGQVKARATNGNLPGVTISISTGGKVVKSVTTNTSGIYLADSDLPTGTYALTASKTGFITQAKANISITAGGTTYVNFFLDRLCIKGQVREAGTAANIAGATVQAYQGDVLKATATTAANGIYEIGGLALGKYTVIASKPGYVRQTKTEVAVIKGEVAYVNFSLAVSGKLKGQVKDKVSGANLGGATITARMGGVVRATGTTTAPWGVYEIDSDLPAGSYIVVASRSGYLPQTKKDIIIVAAATTYANFNLDRGPVITGQVRQAGTSASIAGANVMIWKDGEKKYDTSTDAGGMYEIPSGLLAEGGPYNVAVLADGYLAGGAGNVYITEGVTQHFDIYLDLSGMLKGQVKNKVTGANLEGAAVSVYSDGDLRARVSTSPGTGIYDITTNLPPGTYVVSAAASGYQTQTKNNITVTPGVTTYVNFNLQPQ